MKHLVRLGLVASLALLCSAAGAHPDSASKPVAQRSGAAGSNVFQLVNPDYTQSPFTGVTREHWKAAARYLLEGAFGYVNNLDDPMLFPKQPGKSYPRNPQQEPTAMLEGLCRTLFLAAPLLKEDSTLVIHNIRVADYYRHQISKLLDSTSLTYIHRRSPQTGCTQTLVEFGALAVSLFAIPEVLWQPLPKETKDALAATMISYGDGPTVPSNWKFFNIFILSFFKDQGYTVNEALLTQYLDKCLAHYVGQGWYNDNPAYDYYSMWAFQMYAPLWSEFFGKRYYPAYAEKFMENFKPIKDNYPYMFSRDGKMIMWGRSITYRFGAVIPFALTGLENDPSTNYGWMRRIASGSLLQFLQNPNLLKDGIPTLGFYGPFEPAVQSYSCRGSVFWMGKAFLGLYVPASSPFWTSVENEGAWRNELVKGKAYSKFQEGSKILITDYPNIGASEVRAWCDVKLIGASEPFRSSENYNRLSYSSAFPWQADGVPGVVSMNYIVKNKKGEWEPFRLYKFRRFDDNVYYRDVTLETNSNVRFNLADIPLENGILRIDRNLSTDSIQVRLGHYALPKLTGEIVKEIRRVKGHQVQLISNGEYQLAMVTLDGWDSIQTVDTQGVHPQANESTVINAVDSFIPTPHRPHIYATLMLWKRAGEKWTDDELVPVKGIKYSADGSTVEVSLTKEGRKTIRFGEQ
jgi:hypothetical protein